MGALEHHNINEILQSHNVSLPEEVVVALAQSFRDALLSEAATSEAGVKRSRRKNVAPPPEVHTVDALSINPVVNGETQPCLRALIHGHFLRRYYGLGREAAAKAHQATDAYLEAVAVTPVVQESASGSTSPSQPGSNSRPHTWYADIGGERRYASEPQMLKEGGRVVVDHGMWHPLYEGPAGNEGPAAERSTEAVQRGMACAADICQTYVDSADNYQKRLAAFHCVKRIREAISTFAAVEVVRAKVLDKVCAPGLVSVPC
jgi:hypothetical protein